MQRHLLAGLALIVTLCACACAPQESAEERRHDANTPAGKVGQAAHKAAVEAGKAGRVVGHKLEKAAHDAHEGWKQAAQSEKDKR